MNRMKQYSEWARTAAPGFHPVNPVHPVKPPLNFPLCVLRDLCVRLPPHPVSDTRKPCVLTQRSPRSQRGKAVCPRNARMEMRNRQKATKPTKENGQDEQDKQDSEWARTAAPGFHPVNPVHPVKSPLNFPLCVLRGLCGRLPPHPVSDTRKPCVLTPRSPRSQRGRPDCRRNTRKERGIDRRQRRKSDRMIRMIRMKQDSEWKRTAAAGFHPVNPVHPVKSPLGFPLCVSAPLRLCVETGSNYAHR